MLQLTDNVAVSLPTVLNDRIDGNGGKYVVAAGAALTVNKMPLDGLDQLFDGPGAVVFGPDVPFVRAEWFGAGKGGDDGAIVNRAIAAASAGQQPVHTDRDLVLLTPVVFDAPVSLQARPGSWWNAYGITGTGDVAAGSAIDIRAGTIGREGVRWSLPNVVGALYAGVYLEGVRLLKADGGSIRNCGWGVMFDLLDPTRPTIGNEINVAMIDGCGRDPRFPNWTGGGVMFRAQCPGALQGNRVDVNFLNGNQNHVHFYGYAPPSGGTNLDSNHIECESLDYDALPPMFGNPCVAVRSSITGPPGAAFRSTVNVHSWFGGFHETSVVLLGQFGGAKMYFNPANSLPVQTEGGGGPWQFNANALNNDVRFGQTMVSDPAH